MQVSLHKRRRTAYQVELKMMQGELGTAHPLHGALSTGRARGMSLAAAHLPPRVLWPRLAQLPADKAPCAKVAMPLPAYDMGRSYGVLI